MRMKTLDAIEAVGIWHRRTASPEPFRYNGLNYLARVGPDLVGIVWHVLLNERNMKIEI